MNHQTLYKLEDISFFRRALLALTVFGAELFLVVAVYGAGAIAAFLPPLLLMRLQDAAVPYGLDSLWHFLPFLLFGLAVAALLKRRLTAMVRRQSSYIWLRGVQRLFYDASDLYYTKDTPMKFFHYFSCLRILRIESVRKHFFTWEVRCRYVGFLDQSVDNAVIVQEELLRLSALPPGEAKIGTIWIQRQYSAAGEAKIKALFAALIDTENSHCHTDLEIFRSVSRIN